MDAVIGMDDNGPSVGNPKKLSFITASENAAKIIPLYFTKNQK